MENVNEFETIMSLVEREGKDELMEYIRNSDFYMGSGPAPDSI